MYHLVVIFFFLLLGPVFPTQGQVVWYQDYFLDEIGLRVSVPGEWTHEGINTTTKREFIKNFGWNYTGPEANDVWSSFTSFRHMEVDTTLATADSIQSTHFYTIRVERSRTLFKRWLCGHGMRSTFEELDDEKPGTTVLGERKFKSKVLDVEGFGVFEKSYERSGSHSSRITTGHLYSFSHKDRCYIFKIESTSPENPSLSRLHQSIFSMVQLIE